MNFSDIACWIWPLLAGLICGILGYLIGRMGSGNTNDDGNLELWKRKNASLQADLDACRSKLSAAPSPSVASSTASMASSFAAGAATTAAVSAMPFDAAAAKLAFGKAIKEDDLTVVEGIGPKIRELFHNHDIKTWAALAGTEVSKCQEVLNSGGKRFEIHRPDTWPDQARMAAEGKWATLKKWQDEHDYGKA